MQKAISKTDNPLSASIQYVNQHPAVESAIIGIRTLEQLNQVIESQLVTVPSETLTELSEVLDPNVYGRHR